MEKKFVSPTQQGERKFGGARASSGPVKGACVRDRAAGLFHLQMDNSASRTTNVSKTGRGTRSIRSFVKVVGALLAVLFLAPNVYAQSGVSFYGQIVDQTGKPAPFAQLRVCPNTGAGAPCNPKATIYSDPALTHEVSNPITTDSRGNYNIFVSSGYYILQFSVSGSGMYSYVASAATGGGGATLPTNAPVFGLSPLTSRAAVLSDFVSSSGTIWSGSGCSTGTNFLAANGTCAAGGGGGSPGGVNQDLQWRQNSGTFGGGQMATDSATNTNLAGAGWLNTGHPTPAGAFNYLQTNGIYSAQVAQTGGGNNGIGNALATSAPSATLTHYSVTSNVVTFTAANTFVASQRVAFAGLTGLKAMNGISAYVLSSGLSTSQFEVSFTTANGSGTETGTASLGGGFVIVDPTYLGSDAIGPATTLMQQVVDQRLGGKVEYYFNGLAQTSSTWATTTTNSAGVGGNGVASNGNHTSTFMGFGTNIGNGWVYNSVTQGEQVWNYIPGVYSNNVKQIFCQADADCNHYEYWWFSGIDSGGSAEGNQTNAGHWTQSPYYAGTLSTIIDARHIRTTPVVNGGFEIGGGWLVSPPVETGTLIQQDSFSNWSAYKTSTSHTPSTAYGYTLGQCFGTGGTPDPPNDTVNGQSCGVAVQLLGGTNGQTATFTGTVSGGGTALSVSGVTGTIHVGDTLIGNGVNPSITIASGSGTSWVLSGAYSAGGASGIPMTTVNLSSSSAGFTVGQEICVIGNWTEENTLTAVTSPSGNEQFLTFLSRKPLNTGSRIISGGCQGFVNTAEIQTHGGQTTSYPAGINAGAPDSTHYFGFGFDNATPAGLPISYTSPFAQRDSSGNVAMVLNNSQPFTKISGAPLYAMTGCSTSDMNFSATAVSVAFSQANFPVGSQAYAPEVAFVQPGAGPFTPVTNVTGCVLTTSGAANYQVVNVAEVQSVADPAVASVPGAEQAPINGYFAIGPTNGWLPGAVGQTLLQPGGYRWGMNNTILYNQTTPASPSFKSYWQHFILNNIGSTGPGQAPIVYDNTQNDCSNYQGCGGQWPIQGFNLITQLGPWGGFADVTAPVYPGAVLTVECPLMVGNVNNCTQPYPYTVMQLNGNNNSGLLQFNPDILWLQYSQTFAADVLVANNAAATGFVDAVNAYSAQNNNQGPCFSAHTYGSTSGIAGTDVIGKFCGVDLGGGAHGVGLYSADSGGAQVWMAFFGPTKSSMSFLTLEDFVGGGTQCLETNNAGVVTGTGSACGSGGGGSTVTVNGGSTLSTANFGASPAAGTNGINVTWQASGANVSAEIVGDGNSAHFLNGTGTFTAPSGGSGTVTTSGSPSTNTLALFTGSTVIGNSHIADTGSQINIGETTVVTGSFSASGTITFSGFSTGCLQSSSFGVITNTTANASTNCVVNPLSAIGDIPYGGASGVFSRLAAPTTGTIPYSLTEIPGSAPAWALAGVAGRTVTGTTDTIVAGDRSTSILYNSASSVAVTLTSAATLGSNFSFKACNMAAGTATFTAGAGTFLASGGTTYALGEGQCAVFSSPDNTNYLASGTPGQLTAGTGISLTPSATGTTIAATNTGTVTSAIVAGTANQITASGTCTITSTGTCTLSLPNAVVLGTDNSAAGTVQLANGSAAAHTIFGSGATTTNTINGFVAVPTTGHLIDCTVTSTTCLLHDSGVVTSSVVNASSPGVGVAHFAGSTQTVTSSTVATADIAANAVTSAKVDGSVSNVTSAAVTTLTDSTTVTWTMGSVYNANAKLTFTVHSGSRTLNLSGIAAIGYYNLVLVQDATGGESLTGGTGCTWKQAGGGGSTFTLTATANAIDIISIYYDGTNCYANLNKAFN